MCELVLRSNDVLTASLTLICANMIRRALRTSYLMILLVELVHSNHYLTSAHRSQQATQGKSQSLRCFAVEKALKDMNYEDVEKMEWRKDGYVVAFYTQTPTKTESWVSNPRYSLDRARFSLTIDHPSPDDQGQYKCWPRFRVLPRWMQESHWQADVITLSVVGPPTLPGRPVVLSYASRVALISWAASTTHVDAPIIQKSLALYLVYNRLKHGNNTEVANEDISPGNGTSWLVTGLRPLATYRFQVAAENTIGRSRYSIASYPIRTRGEAPIAPPTILSMYNGTNMSLILTWTLPSTSLPNGRLIGYRLTVAPAETRTKQEIHHVKPHVTTFEILNLTPYTKYMITLEADNVFGISPPATIFALTAEGVPATGPNVTSLRVLSGSEVAITFSRPLITRGILTHFTLYYQVVDMEATQTIPTGKRENISRVKIKMDSEHSLIYHHHLAGLKRCTKYLLWLTASTSRGESVPSAFRYLVTDSFGPSPPVLANISAVENSVVVEWLQPLTFCISVDFYLVGLNGGHSNQRQFNTSETEVVLSNLSPLTRYSISVRAATRSVLISDRQRYYVGPESSIAQLMLFPPSSGETAAILKTTFCPSDVKASPRSRFLKQRWSASSSYLVVYYCDRNLIAPGDKMPAINSTAVGSENKESSQSPSKSGVPVVAVAVLGTLGLLILLLFLIMVLVHFWRRYFHGKDCLAYAADALDNNLRSNQTDHEACDDADCDSIAVEDFVDYVKTMHADSDSGFARLFERAERHTSTDYLQKLSYEYSVMADNKMKNRYVNILAYDHSRVRLRPLPGVKNSDYINASFVDGFRQRRAFIATQGPLPNTVADFWRMVWEHKVNVIVMITNIIERGRKKCEQYWPSEGEESYGAFAVSLISERVTAFYTVRTMALRCVQNKPLGVKDDASRIITQYHCTCWADHGVPESASAILKFIEKSKMANRDPAAPIIVHCSAGVGRSGTYIVIDAMLRQMRATNRLNLYGFLKHIRHQRMCLVQTEEQFIFCYDALAEAISLGDTEISARDFRRFISDWLSDPDSDSSLLSKQYERFTSVNSWSRCEAKKPCNIGKNRDCALLPTDDSRVVITAIPGEPGSDYVNATFFPGYHRTDEFVVTQVPIKETVSSFWRMIWDLKCGLVVHLTQADQDDNLFLPQSQSSESSLTLGSLSVARLATSSSCEIWPCVDLVLRSMRDDADLQCQVLSINWPNVVDQYDQVWQLINSVQKRQSTCDDRPLVVIDTCGGCAAATFCLLSALNCQLDEEDCVDVYSLARCYHERRPGVLPELADYLYIFDCINSRITCLESNGQLMPLNLDSYAAAARSKSLPPSLRAKSNPTLASRPPSCNGYCHPMPLDTTL